MGCFYSFVFSVYPLEDRVPWPCTVSDLGNSSKKLLQKSAKDKCPSIPN